MLDDSDFATHTVATDSTTVIGSGSTLNNSDDLVEDVSQSSNRDKFHLIHRNNTAGSLVFIH